MEGTFGKEVNLTYLYRCYFSILFLKTQCVCPLSLLCRDASLANARLSLERTMADKELLELQLSGSASIDSSTHSDAEKKVGM